MLARLRSFVAAVLRRRDLDRAMDDEFALHLELRVEDLVRRGVSREDAVRQARMEFGNLTATKETARTEWGTAWLDSIGQDLRYTLRGLRKHPGFTAVVVLSLGVGIGATTAVFSVIDALDFRPLPYADPDRLVWLAEVAPANHEMCSRCSFPTSAATAIAWAEQARSVDAVAALSTSLGGFAWEHDDVSESLTNTQTTPGFFDVLGVRPLLGRAFLPADTAAGAELVVLLSFEFWNSRFGADRGVVGRTLTTRDAAALRPVTIIGVLPEQFRFEHAAALWSPLRLNRSAPPSNRLLTVVARLRGEHTIAAASAELETIASRLALQNPKAYDGWGVRAQPLRDLLRMNVANGRRVLFAITTLVLLIAVLNVTGLLLSRSVAREQEFAMRRALGASRMRLIRQVLVEGSCVGIGGGLVGVLIAMSASRFVPHWFAIESAGFAVGIDRRMLAFALLLAALAGLAAAAVPAFRAASPNIRGATSAARASNVLITLQVALALVLLTAAGLLSRDFLELRYFDLGYEPRGLYSTSISRTREQSVDPVAWSAVATAVRARVASVPGVASATLEHISAVHPEVVRPVERSLDTSSRVPVVKAIEPDYFATFGTPLIRGRTFSTGDARGAPAVAVVNTSAAGLLWPGQSAIGRQVLLGDHGEPGELLTVVGVVADAERSELSSRHWPMVYRPFAQAKIYHAAASLSVRLTRNSADVLTALQSAIRQETGRAARPLRSAEAAVRTRLLARQWNAVVLNFFAVFGLALAAMGIFGSVAYAVTRRAREIAIRMAVGATPLSVVALFARRGVFIAVAGVALGTAGAFALTRVLRSFLLGTSVMNPWIFGASAALMIGIALVATLVPSRRATRVDAVIALRAD